MRASRATTTAATAAATTATTTVTKLTRATAVVTRKFKGEGIRSRGVFSTSLSACWYPYRHRTRQRPQHQQQLQPLDCYHSSSCCHYNYDYSYNYSYNYHSQQRCFTTSTTTTNNNNQDDDNLDLLDYSTNDGLVEGVWMFCRHGDRTPGRALSPSHRQSDEAAFWMARLPYPDTAAAFEALSRRFPVEILQPPPPPTTSSTSVGSPQQQVKEAAAAASTTTTTTTTINPSGGALNQGRFIDVARNPFGFLTQTGIEQMRETGHRFFNRYNHHGHHLPDRLEWRWEVAHDFLSVWNVRVYSTNYLRTILSVQSFLDGLLGTQCYISKGHRQYDPNITQEARVPDHSWIQKQQQERKSDDEDPTLAALVKVCVRYVSNDPLNAFDRNPDLIADLVSEVMCSDTFQTRDAAAAPLAARLANVLPGLARRKMNADFSQGTPSGINWVEAADHFVCRQAHNLEYSRFSDYEHEERFEQTLAAMSHPVFTHLAWRFRQWYQNKRLLAAIAAPPLREIANQMILAPHMTAHDKRPFYVYSCHDITILGLLYGIGADFLADDTVGNSAWRWWPQYGSQLVFELVRIPPSPDSTSSSSSSTHVVRVLLNGKPVTSVDHDPKRAQQRGGAGRYRRPIFLPLGTGPKHMLTVDDFLRLVSDLEEAGGLDYTRLLGGN